MNISKYHIYKAKPKPQNFNSPQTAHPLKAYPGVDHKTSQPRGQHAIVELANPEFGSGYSNLCMQRQLPVQLETSSNPREQRAGRELMFETER